MDPLAYRTKLKLLFERLAQPGYRLDPHYADQLLLQLRPADPGIAKLLGSPFFSDLLLESLLHVETASVPVRVFFLKLIAAAATNELQFTKLIKYPGFHVLKGVVDIAKTDLPPSVRVAYIEMASTLTMHNSGVTWLLETETWKHVFNLCYQSQTVYVLRSAYKFICELTWKLNDYGEEENIIKIMEYILKPIVDSMYHQMQTISQEEEVSISAPLLPTLHTILAILKKISEICKPNIVVKVLNRHFAVKYSLIGIIHITRNEEVMIMISKIVFLLALSNAVQNTSAKPIDNEKPFDACYLLDLSICYFNTVHLYIQRRLVNNLFDFCVFCNLYLSDVFLNHAPTLVERNGRTINLQNQLIIIPLVPILCYVKKTDHVCKTVMDEYVNKLMNQSCQHTTRAAYALRDLIFENDARDIALQSIKRLFLLKNHLNTSQANTIFQGLFYVMTDFVPVDKSNHLILNVEPQVIEEKLPVMSLAVDAVLMLLKGHNINWHESFEIICLYNQLCNVLKMQNLPCKFVVQSLSLVTLAVKKFIPPNLALLLESKDGSSLSEIGDLIYCKMHDHNWEVRDSALELLLECTEIAFIKYMPFQKLILSSNLISTAVTVALNDSEFYVQTTALKCLAAATKMQNIWDDILVHHPDLYIKLTSILKFNSEGVVRKEAANVLCEIFQNQKINDSLRRRILWSMASASLEDLHWEVQLVSLTFWRAVVHEQLAYQGMIDGKFPAVTFSKAKRKIVNLNEGEIQKRLITILENLSANGCLRVLLKTLDDDIDVEVMEVSLAISQDFNKILTEYNVSSIIKNENTEPPPVGTNDLIIPKQEDDMEMPPDAGFMDTVQPNESDAVIEGILQADDMNLLAHIYQSQLKIDSEVLKEENMIDPSAIVVEQKVCPFTYMKAFRDTDFKSVIEEKRNWNAGIRSLHSVLDDILGLYEISEVNSLDCY